MRNFISSFRNRWTRLAAGAGIGSDADIAVEGEQFVAAGAAAVAEVDAALYEAIVLDAAEPIISLNGEGVVFSWNLGAQKVFDHAAEDMIGRRFSDVLPDEAAEVVRQAIVAALRNGSNSGRLIRLPMPDAERWFELSASRLEGNFDDPICALVARDISTRVKDEAELSRIWQTVEQCPLGIIMTDTELVIQYANRAYAEISGYSRGDLVGQSARILQWRNRDGQPLDDFAGAIEASESWSGERDLVTSDGSIIHTRTQLVPLRRYDDTITGYCSTLEDTTQRMLDAAELDTHRHNLQQIIRERTAELSLAMDTIRTNEERYGFALEATQDGIWDWDLTSDVVECNHAFFSMLGYERDQLGRSAQECLFGLIHPAECDVVREVFSDARKAGAHADSDMFALEYRMRAHDGSYRWIECRAKAVARDEQGRPQRIVGSHSDLTMRKQVELDLRAAKEAAEAASQAKGSFLANMSHELRTPLNAVIGMTYLMQQSIDDPVQNDRLKKINEAGQHLLGVISDILDTSKIESGKLTLEEADFETRHLMNRVTNMVQERAASKGLELQIVLDPAIPPYLKGDSLRLGQVLINFVNNAIKFTDTGGVTVWVKTLDEDERGVRLHFSVRDTGVGLTQQQIGKLFQSFQQADESTSRRFGGTGLGLAISKELVNLMGGEVGVESEVGQGSNFWFMVRLRRGAGVKFERSSVGSKSQIRRGARVLLVDDNEINREIAFELLEGAGLEVDTAANGQEVLDKLAPGRYELVVMDVQMPVMDGLEASRRIRLQPEYANLPVVAMTANAFEEDRRQCRDAGMNDYLAKPVSPGSLYTMLARWLPIDGGQAAMPAQSAPAAIAPVENTAPVVAAEPGSASPSTEVAPAAAAAGLAAVPAAGAKAPINIEDGLQFCDGRTSSYYRLLGKFRDSRQGAAQEMRAALSAGDRATAMRHMHSMKGLAATLGAHELARIARELEVQTHEGTADAGLLTGIDVLEHEMRRVFEQIDGLIAESSAT